jgi:hypothetical protein
MESGWTRKSFSSPELPQKSLQKRSGNPEGHPAGRVSCVFEP